MLVQNFPKKHVANLRGRRQKRQTLGVGEEEEAKATKVTHCRPTFWITVKPRFTDTRVIRTHRYFGQFSLSLGERKPLHSS